MAILIRPVREQFEHDRVIRELELKLRRRFGVEANVGEDRKAAVKSGGLQLFPDLVLTQADSGKKPHAIVEVETGESVNHLEAMGQWARFSKVRAQFLLYVPAASIDATLRLCKAHRVSPTEVWTFLPYGDQFRFTQVTPTPGLVEPDLDLEQIRADRRAAEALAAAELEPDETSEDEVMDEPAVAAAAPRRKAAPAPEARAARSAGAKASRTAPAMPKTEPAPRARQQPSTSAARKKVAAANGRAAARPAAAKSVPPARNGQAKPAAPTRRTTQPPPAPAHQVARTAAAAKRGAARPAPAANGKARPAAATSARTKTPAKGSSTRTARAATQAAPATRGTKAKPALPRKRR